MKKFWQNVVLLVASTFFFSACQKAQFDPELTGSPIPDIKNSDISFSGSSVADGRTPINVHIELISKLGIPVKNVEMNLSVSGEKNVVLPCSRSNENGHIDCIFYTSQGGVKSIVATGPINLQKELFLVSPKPLTAVFSFVSSTINLNLPSGHRVIGASGLVHSEPVQKDSFNTKRNYLGVLEFVHGEF